MELGYRLRRDVWGCGLATEGSLEVLRRACNEWEIPRVVAQTLSVNTASRRVMEKAGLKFVRIVHRDWPIHVDGDEHGETEYALTRAEWEAKQRAPGHGTWKH